MKTLINRFKVFCKRETDGGMERVWCEFETFEEADRYVYENLYKNNIKCFVSIWEQIDEKTIIRVGIRCQD